jgi:hypothetical protein
MGCYLSLLPHGEWVFGLDFFASDERFIASPGHPKMSWALLAEVYACGSDL